MDHDDSEEARFAGRVRDSLHAFAEMADREGTRAVAVTHGAWVRAAVVTALSAPPSAFWQIDIAPGSLTELHVRSRQWSLMASNRPPQDWHAAPAAARR